MVRKWMWRVAKVGMLLVFVIIVGLHVIDKWMYSEDAEIVEMFEGSGTEVSVDRKKTQAGNIRVVVEQVEEGDSTLIIFVHGAPGAFDAFKMYMLDDAMAKQGQLISYDRPGYSRGTKSTASVTEQAEVLMSIVREYKLPEIVLVGHSYGGPIVAKCLSKYPMEVDKAVMIAPVNDPDHEPMFWFSYFSKWKFSKWLLPNSFQVAGDEKFAHAQELKLMKSYKITILVSGELNIH